MCGYRYWNHPEHFRRYKYSCWRDCSRFLVTDFRLNDHRHAIILFRDSGSQKKRNLKINPVPKEKFRDIAKKKKR